jgi:hypothetical protein
LKCEPSHWFISPARLDRWMAAGASNAFLNALGLPQHSRKI